MEQEPRIISSDEFNARVASFGTGMGQKIRGRISMLSNKGKGDLLKSFRLKTRKFYGEIDKLSYTFLQHGVFWHKGVGRGYTMVSGKVVRVSGSESAREGKAYASFKNRVFSPKIISDVAFNRKPEEWFNPVIESDLDRLADLVSEMRADQAVRATNFLAEKKLIAID